MEYRIAICDDEKEQRAYLRGLIEEWLYAARCHAEIAEYAGSEPFLFERAYEKTQILFLDIEMGKMDGIALAREIRAHNREMQIIFVTGYMEYIQEGYDVEALHYLLKPVSGEKMASVMERAVRRLATAGDALLIEHGDGLVRIPLKEIRYIEASRNYVCIHAMAEYEVRSTLSDMEKKLDDAFVRAGRSCIVNLHFIWKITKTELYLADGAVIPIPRGSYKKLNEAMIQYF